MTRTNLTKLINSTKNEEVKNIANLLVVNKRYIDDHNGNMVTPKVVILKNDDTICAGFEKNEAAYFCLNPFYIGEGGEVHAAQKQRRQIFHL